MERIWQILETKDCEVKRRWPSITKTFRLAQMCSGNQPLEIQKIPTSTESLNLHLSSQEPEAL